MSQELKRGFSDNLEVWAGVGSGREAQEGGDIRVPMIDPC